MGYGLPAALGLQTLYPKRTIVCVAGDGDFLMTGQDFATCVQYERPVIVLVCDNGLYGTIRMHQEREYPERVSGTPLANPDFTGLAQAYGYAAARVTATAEFEPALLAALEREQGTLIEIVLDPEVITTRGTLSAIRRNALKK
jgi:acetolactate synthase I/II/III large subunit